MYQGRDERPQRQGQPASVASTPPGSAPTTPPAAPSTTGELERLAELRDRGVLTEAEFQIQKKKILGP
jgi:hypothetical protein